MIEDDDEEEEEERNWEEEAEEVKKKEEEVKTFAFETNAGMSTEFLPEGTL